MKLYDGRAPNPRRVRIFIAEKGIAIPTERLNLQKGEARAREFIALNSLGETPVLALDDGTVITESVAICRYLEEIHPLPPLFGDDAVARACVEMWNRRMEIQIMRRLGSVAEHTFEFFQERLTQVPAYAEAQRVAAAERWLWLDRELADGRPYIAGDAFSIADITGMAASMIGDFVEVPIPESATHVKRWDDKMRARPSWNA